MIDFMVVVVATMALLTVTTAVSTSGQLTSSKDREFNIGLMQEHIMGGATLQVVSDVANNVNVQAPYIGLSKNYVISPGVTSIPLDQGLRDQSSELTFKGIRLTADHPVTVYVVDAEAPFMGGYLALPNSALTSEYIVASYTPNENSQLLVAAVMDRTSVIVNLTTSGVVSYKGRQFRNGDAVSVVMDQYETLQLQCTADLTGTTVNSGEPVAVLSGSACASIPAGSPRCDYAVEQMPPLSSWGKDFIVPHINSRSKYFIRVVGSIASTSVSFTHNGSTTYHTVNKGAYISQEVSRVLISTSYPVLVVQYFESQNFDGSSGGPSMTIIPSLKQYSKDYVIPRPSNVDLTTAAIIIPTSSVSGLRVNHAHPVPISQHTVYIKDLLETYTVYEVNLNSPENFITHLSSSQRFGVLVYTSKGGYSYSHPGGLMLDIQQETTPARLVGGSSPREGRVEILYNGQWGTICSDNFDRSDGFVVCKMLGYKFSPAQVTIHQNAHYGQGSGHVVIDNLNCVGTEADVTSCPSSKWLAGQCDHSKDVGVDCGTPIRLVGTNDSREGRLEVFYNDQWGGVCDDNFGSQEASVICRMLDYGNKGYVYTGSRLDHAPVWLDDVHCQAGEADIAQCMTKGWGESDCSDREDVWVACHWPTPLRLVGGPSAAAGRLEVSIKKDWTTVCDYTFDVRDADVVCRTLGFKHASTQSTVHKGAYYGAGTGVISISGLDCTGQETDIAECISRPWLIPDPSCNHGHDVGVSCGSAVRLVNGSSALNGRLEVYYQGNWGTVCDDNFDANDAKVVCSLLGYHHGPAVNPFLGNAYFGMGTGPIVIDDLNCQGSETNIAHCPSQPWGQNNCEHTEDVGVDCGTSVRLVDGTSPSDGRLEVFYDGMWGTVCDDRFDLNDAEVVCNMLGFKYHVARKVKSGAYYGSGQGRVIIGELHCTGNELDIGQCPSDAWLTTTCTHNEDVGIDCGVRLQDVVTMSCTSTHWTVRVHMRDLLRAVPNAKASDLYIGDLACIGRVNGDYLEFTQGLHQCLTSEQDLGTNRIFRNSLVYAYHDPIHPDIIRYHNWTMDMTCTVRTDGSVDSQIMTPVNPTGPTLVDTAKFNVIQGYYSDSNFQNVINLNGVAVGTVVYVKIYTTDADSSQKMILKDCYTSSGPGDPNKYYVIKDSCETDSSAHVMQTLVHETRLQFRVFATTTSNGLHLHCDVNFCPINDYTPACTFQCRQVGRSVS